jgi:hypothetical protein
MTYRRAFRVGDVIKVGEYLGTVSQVRLMVTRLRTPKNEDVVVPNSRIRGRTECVPKSEPTHRQPTRSLASQMMPLKRRTRPWQQAGGVRAAHPAIIGPWPR